MKLNKTTLKKNNKKIQTLQKIQIIFMILSRIKNLIEFKVPDPI